MSRTMTDDVRTSPKSRRDAASAATPDPAAGTAADPAAVIPAAPDRPDQGPVVVRRHGSLSALIGLGASALSALYLVRAVDQGGTASWGVGLVLGLLALFHLTQWVDSRTPLLVADGTGVRLRLGNVWHGLLWDDVDRVSVHPRQGLFSDGRIVVHPFDETALGDLNGRSRRRLAANTRLYGAPFALPLGLTTVSSTDDLAGSLQALASAGTRVDVVEPAPEAADPPAPSASPASEPADERPVDDLEAGADSDADTSPDLPVVAARGADLAEPIGAAPPAPDPTREPTPGPEPEPGPEPAPPPEPGPGPEPVPTREPQPTPQPGPGLRDPQPVEARHVQPELSDDPLDDPPQPLRPVRRARRAEITRPRVLRAAVHGQLALQEPAPAADDVSDPHDGRAEGRPDGRDERRGRPSGVRGNMSLVPAEPAGPAAAPAEPEPEPEPRPAVQPVIGPVVTEARRLLGLTVDELAARTRIRPHVIEAIEVDDFAPCAGDFYARGHLRALGRVLGIDAQPLVEVYERRYATEPISARRVFEAELAAGDSGAFRGVGTITRPRWGALVVAVVLLALFWGLAALFLDDAAGSADDLPERPRTSAPLQPGSSGR